MKAEVPGPGAAARWLSPQARRHDNADQRDGDHWQKREPLRQGDTAHASYDSAHAHRFFRMLLQADRITKRVQGRFLGKTSPVHFFWGAFDLALTRFSGRRVPEHKDTEWWVLREANSHEEISVGFWPGSGTVAEPAFYAYTRPEPPGLASTPIRPAAAYYSRDLADFILPYEAVRSASSPDEAVLDFLSERIQRRG